MAKTAQQAYDALQPQKWAETSIEDRLNLIEQIKDNLDTYGKEVAQADADMKNAQMGEKIVTLGEGMGATVGPIANMLMGATVLYKALEKGEMPQAGEVKDLGNGIFEVQTYPFFGKDKLTSNGAKGYLHIEGQPKQINPMDKKAGVIAISGAGNYSSSVEMVKALFFENKAVIHKPHRLNEKTDAVWEKIFAPLVELGALQFVGADQSRNLTSLAGLDAIYFTGSTEVAKAIMAHTDTPFVGECGGNNPCIIVPGKWTEKEMKHQAIQIISAAKLNGGAVCGRPQTLVTSKAWPQRKEFLEILKKAITEDTFGSGTYYPGVDETKAKFLEAHPEAENLKVEGGKYSQSDFVFIEGIGEESFGVKNEAFCQIMSEVPLDTENDAEDFLKKATTFCNEKLLGTLGCMILIDENTQREHQKALDEAIVNLNYGGLAVNTIPALIWMNAYLTWGGCGETEETFVSGIGNFGNAFNFENVKKSVLINSFSSTSFAFTNRKMIEDMLINNSEYSIHQSWGDLMKLIGGMMIDGMRGKDF